MSCTISMSDIWFCCTFCKARHAPFNTLLQELPSHRTKEKIVEDRELPSHRTKEKTWFLLHDNAGFTNVTMEGGRPINEALLSVRPIQVRDGGGGKLLETSGAIYTKTLVGRVWKVLEMPRDVYTSLHYGGKHERSARLSKEF
ncbi:hypothetical protein CK203_039011 [Vitis vinifera]|uniref:Uncharacterized protein n=1 Tax=Vitis vinifera TaxID=29760 RepID=A0A438HLT5_VITVI|nr:hypothetical protein CK203_039011 [Vitis vinifera]